MIFIFPGNNDVRNDHETNCINGSHEKKIHHKFLSCLSVKFLVPAIFNLTRCLHEVFFSQKITADLSAGSWFTPLFLMLSWWLREPIGWQQATVAWRKKNSFQTVYSRELIVWKLFWDETPQRWVASGFPLETKCGSIVKVTFDADYCLLLNDLYVIIRCSHAIITLEALMLWLHWLEHVVLPETIG